MRHRKPERRHVWRVWSNARLSPRWWIRRCPWRIHRFGASVERSARAGAVRGSGHTAAVRWACGSRIRVLQGEAAWAWRGARAGGHSDVAAGAGEKHTARSDARCVALGEGVPEDAGEELGGAQVQQLRVAVAMVGVAQADLMVPMAHQVFGVERPALGVARQVGQYAASVYVARTDQNLRHPRHHLHRPLWCEGYLDQP